MASGGLGGSSHTDPPRVASHGGETLCSYCVGSHGDWRGGPGGPPSLALMLCLAFILHTGFEITPTVVRSHCVNDSDRLALWGGAGQAPAVGCLHSRPGPLALLPPPRAEGEMWVFGSLAGTGILQSKAEAADVT